MPHSGLRVAPRNAYTSAPSANPCVVGYGFDSGGGFSGGASRAARSSSASISAAVHVRAGGRGDVRRHSAGFATHDLSSLVVTRRNVQRARAASTATLTAAPALPHPTTQRCDQPHGTTWSTPGGFSFCFARATPIRPSDAACVIARWTVRTEHPTFAASFDRNAQQSRCDPMLPSTRARVVVIPSLRARSKIARASDGTGPSQRDDTAAAVMSRTTPQRLRLNWRARAPRRTIRRNETRSPRSGATRPTRRRQARRTNTRRASTCPLREVVEDGQLAWVRLAARVGVPLLEPRTRSIDQDRRQCVGAVLADVAHLVVDLA